MIEPLNLHYSFTNPASVYDEEALTALQLAGRQGAKINEVINDQNALRKETAEHLTKQDESLALAIHTAEQTLIHYSTTVIPQTVKQEFQENVNDGTFAGMVDRYAGNLTARLENLLGTVKAGSTSMDAEVIDGRVSVDNITYNNIGEATRSQINRADNMIEGLCQNNGEAIPIPFKYLEAFRNDSSQLQYFPSQIYSVCAYVKPGHKIRIGLKGNPNRCNICFANSIESGSPVSDSFKRNFNGIDGVYHEYEITVPYDYSIIIVSYFSMTGGTLPNVEVSLWDVTGEKPITEPNIQHPEITHTHPSGGVIASHEKGYGFSIRMQPATNYKIKVTGKHNRFYAYGCDDLLIGTTGESVFNLGQDIHTEREYEFFNLNHKYLCVCVGYTDGAFADGYDENCTVEVYEHYGSDVSWRGIKLKELVEPESPVGFYKTPYDVSNVSKTVDVYALYDGLMNTHPDYVTRNTIGEDDDATPIYEYVFGGGDYNTATNNQRGKDSVLKKHTILITAGTHGYERTSVMATYQFFRDLCSSTDTIFENMKKNICFKVVPVVTPYSFDHDSRVNKNGVNIARNFSTNWKQTSSGQDYSGTAPANQKETIAIQNWINNNQSAMLMIDYHNSGYTHEVSYLAGSVLMPMETMQYIYFHAINNVTPYWKSNGLTSDDLIYAYTGFTGNFNSLATSFNYATAKGVQGLCLEGSWNQNNTFGQHSKESIGICAEILGNLLIGFTDYFMKG